MNTPEGTTRAESSSTDNARIAIVWDFDGTLSPHDSTSHVVEVLSPDGSSASQFWDDVRSLRGDKETPSWEHVLASDAPIWMHALSRLAVSQKKPLNSEFFREFVVDRIELFQGVRAFLEAVTILSDTEPFRRVNLTVQHFIVSAGLKDLIELVFPNGEMTWIFGCRYTIVAQREHEDEPESVPVFCMDETVKTRSLFEINKGSFRDRARAVNRRVRDEDRWVPFENMIYVGDGPTDIPALSLVRDKGGMGVLVYDPDRDIESVNRKIGEMQAEGRADLVTPADFSASSELRSFIETRCHQIRQRYEATQGKRLG